VAVRQKVQSRAHPTWEERQNVTREGSGMKTDSIRPRSTSMRYLRVPSVDASTFSTRGLSIV
jgi:hypothetical protein